MGNTGNLFSEPQASGQTVKHSVLTLAITLLTLPVTPQANPRGAGTQASNLLELPLRTAPGGLISIYKDIEIIPPLGADLSFLRRDSHHELKIFYTFQKDSAFKAKKPQLSLQVYLRPTPWSL